MSFKLCVQTYFMVANFLLHPKISCKVKNAVFLLLVYIELFQKRCICLYDGKRFVIVRNVKKCPFPRSILIIKYCIEVTFTLHF